MIAIPANKKLILFDGVCNFCNDSVLKISKYDTKNVFVFASIQSRVGQQVIKYLKIDTEKTNSIILYEPNVSYDIKSSAALKIMSHFGGLWKLTQLFWVFPRPIRDAVYDFIAKNRYQWFGKKDECMLPTPKFKEKFLQ